MGGVQIEGRAPRTRGWDPFRPSAIGLLLGLGGRTYEGSERDSSEAGTWLTSR